MYSNHPEYSNFITSQLIDNHTLPVSVDWLEMGVVNPIKDQGNCGSCYAFAATNAVESAYYIKTGQLHDLSEQ